MTNAFLANVSGKEPGSSNKIGDIQVLRGVSILVVLVCHLSISATLLALPPVKLTSPFFLGVEIFFIISGLVITNSLILDGFDGLRFFIKRAFRLLPAMAVFLAITLLLNSLLRTTGLSEQISPTAAVTTKEFARQASSIIFGYFILLDGPKSYCNGAMWSLSVEDQFYAVVALLCVLTGVSRRFGSKSTGSVICCLAGALYAASTFLRGCILWESDLAARAPVLLKYLTQWRFDFLALGIVLAFINARFGKQILEYFRNSGAFISPWLLTVPFFICSVCEPAESSSPRFLHGFGYPIAGFLFGPLVLLAANNLAFPPTKNYVYKTMLFLGDRSYTLYLMHYPVFIIAWLLFHWLFPRAFSGAIMYGVCQAIAVGTILLPLCEIVYRYIELPFARLGRRIAASLGKPSPAHAALSLQDARRAEANSETSHNSQRRKAA